MVLRENKTKTKHRHFRFRRFFTFLITGGFSKPCSTTDNALPAPIIRVPGNLAQTNTLLRPSSCSRTIVLTQPPAQAAARSSRLLPDAPPIKGEEGTGDAISPGNRSEQCPLPLASWSGRQPSIQSSAHSKATRLLGF